jgi:predicted nucleotidyltransferase
MVLEKDFREFCSLLNEEKIDFLIVGGYAVAFHGAPRATGDIDILIRPELEHVVRLLAAIERFGFPTQGVTPEYLLDHSKILQLGRVPVQIHIMTSITGVPWKDAWGSRQKGVYGGVPVFFIGLSALLANKAAAARAKDIADIKALRRK